MYTKVIVTEQYLTIQGTGILTGVDQYFVRFAGCSVLSCPIRKACDQPESLSRFGAVVSVESVVEKAADSSSWLHITGGEPCDQPEALRFLTEVSQAVGLCVQIQTSGTKMVECNWDVLSLSPKSKANDLVQKVATEVIVVFDPKFLTLDDLINYYDQIEAKCFWLQPVCTREGMFNYQETIDMIRELRIKKQSWRLASQLHKHIGIK